MDFDFKEMHILSNLDKFALPADNFGQLGTNSFFLLAIVLLLLCFLLGLGDELVGAVRDLVGVKNLVVIVRAKKVV